MDEKRRFLDYKKRYEKKKLEVSSENEDVGPVTDFPPYISGLPHMYGGPPIRAPHLLIHFVIQGSVTHYAL